MPLHLYMCDAAKQIEQLLAKEGQLILNHCNLSGGSLKSHDAVITAGAEIL